VHPDQSPIATGLTISDDLISRLGAVRTVGRCHVDDGTATGPVPETGAAMTTMSDRPPAAPGVALARRAANFAPSFWGDLEAVLAGHDDLVFFGGGTPAPELIPVERLRAASPLAWTDAPFALDYGEVAGYRPLRELIAGRMVAQGIRSTRSRSRHRPFWEPCRRSAPTRLATSPSRSTTRGFRSTH